MDFGGPPDGGAGRFVYLRVLAPRYKQGYKLIPILQIRNSIIWEGLAVAVAVGARGT